MDASVTHAYGVCLVDFWPEEAGDEGKEDFGEDGGPFLVGGRGEFWGEEGGLERGEGLMADLAAGIEALSAEGFENGGPVG